MLAKHFRRFKVHLMVNEPESCLRDTTGKLFNFNAIQLLDVNLEQVAHIEKSLSFKEQLDYLVLQSPELAIGERNKDPTTACWVKKFQGR